MKGAFVRRGFWASVICGILYRRPDRVIVRTRPVWYCLPSVLENQVEPMMICGSLLEDLPLTPYASGADMSFAAADFAGPLRLEMADGDDDVQGGQDDQVGTITRTKPKTKKPSLYKVLLLNDDYTPMEFVVHILEQFFNKDRDEAMKIMLHVHQRGVGVCGVYTYEVAETKVTQVIDYSRQNQHPLQCTMEKE